MQLQNWQRDENPCSGGIAHKIAFLLSGSEVSQHIATKKSAESAPAAAAALCARECEYIDISENEREQQQQRVCLSRGGCGLGGCDIKIGRVPSDVTPRLAPMPH
jgi:hypothetical protein